MKGKKEFIDGMSGTIIKASQKYSHRVIVGVPTTGLVRFEWVMGRYGQVIPCNWSQVDFVNYYRTTSPIGFQVAEARNIIATIATKENFEWLFFIDHDVIIPHTTILKMNDFILKHRYPVVSGLYFTKSVPAEPIIYRGRGNSYYTNWKLGDKVWVDGVPMGCTLIHTSIFKAMWNDCEEYDIEGQKVRRFFITPATSFFDPETKTWQNASGTEDLNWCKRVIEGKYLQRAGWADIAKKKYPFLLDTGIFCKHISQEGIQFPSQGEEVEFIYNKKVDDLSLYGVRMPKTVQVPCVQKPKKK
jgi:hypothetical protein